jgi:hypothetical protein
MDGGPEERAEFTGQTADVNQDMNRVAAGKLRCTE